MGSSDSLHDLLAWLEAAPAGTIVPASTIAERLGSLLAGVARPVAPPPTPHSWRERLWEVPAETRLGIHEVAEALGRSRSWIYRRTGPRSRMDQIPHHKLDGELIFVAGELREWLRQRQNPVVALENRGKYGRSRRLRQATTT